MGSTSGRPRWALRRLRCSTSLSWMWPQSASMISHSSRVWGVAKIGPRYPARTSFGSWPEWSMWAWVSSTASICSTANGKVL